MIRTKQLPGGRTATIESFWNAKGTAFFRGPAGVKINVKYGKGRFSVNRQVQVLDGKTIKKLIVGRGSVLYARMRAKATQSTEITYDVYPGNVAITTPEIPF